MRDFKALFPLLTVFAAVVTWLILSEPGAKILSRWISPWQPAGPQVGLVTELQGSMKSIRDGKVEKHESPLSVPVPVFSGDRLEVDARSKANLRLNSKDEFELSALSAVSLQLWSDRDANSPIYLSLMSGELELRQAGTKGKAYVVREGRLYLPGQKASAKPLALTVLKNAPLDMDLAEPGPAPASPSTDLSETPEAKEEETPSASFGSEPETLANEYIDETIASRQNLLQKCWLARVKDDPNAKAQMVIQFEISRRGKVKDPRISESSLDDDTLKKCVIQVFERLSFRSFKGPEIALSYPLQFE